MPAPIPIDYTTLPTYDSRLLSKEDRQLYLDLLPSIPYSPELMEFFHTEKRRQENYSRTSCRHLIQPFDPSSVSENRFFQYCAPDPEDLFLKKEEERQIQKRIESIPKKHRKRFLRYCGSGKSYKTLAEEEGVSEGSIRYSVRLARKTLEKYGPLKK